MRLTHLKLAGFKSFVDPTTIHMHGQRIGVVGPNGCGKSNVMESVKWVLGESSAKEMRADSMDSVIFNGSGNRKAISRASVELIFDNSMGGASGEWNQYAEISVKRVIERDKGSNYYINNTSVRKRDVADLFLGTGLGGRGYAIIGQNTISRIVEAKPEELRVFLEEAAGISKYKERRRETELRLRDTRENLTRVEDICKELQKQINRLASQALVTEKYINLQNSIKHAEGQLWYLRKRDAANAWNETKADVEKLANALEAKTAELRASENKLETTRQAHHAANEAINLAQAAYYEANAEVSNLENQVQQTQEARERMHHQLQQVEQSLEKNARQLEDFTTQLKQQEAEIGQAEALEAETGSTLARLTQGLPDKDTALKQANEAVQAAQQTLNQAKQRIQIEQNNVQYLAQNKQDLTQRIARYQEELSALNQPDQAAFAQHETLIAQLQEKQSAQEIAIKQMSEQESGLLNQLNQLRGTQTEAQRAFNQAEAEVRSLEKLQQSLNQESNLSEWLSQHGFNDNARLWQQVQIAPEWHTALEAILGARLNALIAETPAKQRPPSALVLGLNQTASSSASEKKGFASLLSVLEIKDKALTGVLQDWLHGVYLLDTQDNVQSLVQQLAAGECLINAEGDIYTRNSVSYHGEQSGMQGVLERQKQLELAQQSLPVLSQQLASAVASLNQDETALKALREQQQAENNALRTITNELHQAQMDFSKLKQAQEAASNRERNINNELSAAQEKSKTIDTQVAEKEAAIAGLNSNMNALEQQAQESSAQKQTAEQAYFALRDDIQQAEKLHQERDFNKRLISNNINDLNDRIKVNGEEKINLDNRQKEAKETLERTTMAALKENLTKSIDLKQLKEVALAAARDALAEQDTALQAEERIRMQNEQQLHPMRDAVEQSRLKEQEARLHFEQCQAGLEENGLAEAELTEGLTEETKTSELEDKTMKLTRDIDRLGPVNMAAIQELSGEKERKVYLDSQMEDLTQASNTLENAIRKIDKETRSKLQATFDEANRNFNELFSVLFGGGRAKLELLGEEILDTGIQVFAQPPGKKNTTIQMLSGGEKALTATALVFALFRLNPAPFCLMDEVDAPLDDSNTERFCQLVKKMSEKTQFMIVSHNKITMEIMQQLIGVTMQESGVSRIVDVDLNAAMQMHAG